MRNVIVIPGKVVIETGRDTQKRDGRPLYFSHRDARNWVNRGEAEWLGRGEMRIRLTPAGQKRFLEMKATLKLRGFSAIVGGVVAGAKEPWAWAFAKDQLDRPVYRQP